MERRTAVAGILLLIAAVSGSFLLLSDGEDIEEGSGTDELRVGAFYYPWYDDSPRRHWQQGYVKMPRMGEYDSRNETVIGNHIERATNHGIDFFLVSWWGPEGTDSGWEDETFKDHILTHPRADEMEYAVLYESAGRLGPEINMDHPEDRLRMKEDFRYIARNYFDDPNYMEIDDRPVVFVYVARSYKGDYSTAFQEVRDELGEMGYDIYLIGDVVHWQSPQDVRRRVRQFDAVTAYTMYTTDEEILYGDLPREMSRLYGEWEKLAAEEETAFIPETFPGFNDRPVRPEAENPILSRDPARFRLMLEAAKNHTGDGFLLLTSWNEWHENTQLEPSMEDGGTMLDVVSDVLGSE